MIEDQETLLAGRCQLKCRLSAMPSMRDATTTVPGADLPQATAWLAFDIHLHSKVFIKIVSADTGDDIADAQRDMWQRLARFRHPGMSCLLHFGKEADRSFVVTDWL